MKKEITRNNTGLVEKMTIKKNGNANNEQAFFEAKKYVKKIKRYKIRKNFLVAKEFLEGKIQNRKNEPKPITNNIDSFDFEPEANKYATEDDLFPMPSCNKSKRDETSSKESKDDALPFFSSVQLNNKQNITEQDSELTNYCKPFKRDEDGNEEERKSGEHIVYEITYNNLNDKQVNNEAIDRSENEINPNNQIQ